MQQKTNEANIAEKSNPVSSSAVVTSTATRYKEQIIETCDTRRDPKNTTGIEEYKMNKNTRKDMKIAKE